ncbi:MAG: 3-phosphoglycerate dehydrogenase [Candidatus Thorarchaeota archaeon]|nr:MAG: 3-phosphoglycerate dehydrogenase [Candidatus Thorarchaeota archaeon]
MARVLIADPISESAQKRLEKAGLTIVVRKAETDGPLEKQIKGFECIVVRSATKVTKEVIAAADKLKLIVRAGVGLDNVDAEAAKAKGIKVLNTPEGPSVSVAELVFGLMLSLIRFLPTADHTMKEEKWEKKKLEGTELYKKTLGIIGLGRIGAEVAKRAKAFDMDVLAYDVIDINKACKDLGIKRSELKDIIEKSDFLTLHVPLVPQTKGMIGEKELARMKKTAYIINTSRGGIVDEAALLKALDAGTIAGAGLDVYVDEPPKDWKLVKHPKVVASPHIASSTLEAQVRIGELTVDKVIKELTGK